MFFIHATAMVALVVLIVWMMMGDEIVSTITGILDHLCNPMLRKLKAARKITCD